MNRKNALWSTCLHESAHAIVAIEMGMHVYGVRVKNKDYGETEYEYPSCPIIFTCINLSGSIAEILWGNNSGRNISADDWTDVRKRRVSEIGMAFIFSTLKSFIRARKALILKLAKEVMRKRKLNNKEIIKILGE